MAFFSFILGIGVYNYDTSTQEATEYCYGLIILGGLPLFYSTYGFLKLFKLKKIEYDKNFVYIYEENQLISELNIIDVKIKMVFLFDIYVIIDIKNNKKYYFIPNKDKIKPFMWDFEEWQSISEFRQVLEKKKRR